MDVHDRKRRGNPPFLSINIDRAKQLSSTSKPNCAARPHKKMEFLILLLIGLLIAIFVLPFVALAKANSAKRSVADSPARLSSPENQVRSLRPQAPPAPKPAAAAPPMEPVRRPPPTTT